MTELSELHEILGVFPGSLRRAEFMRFGVGPVSLGLRTTMGCQGTLNPSAAAGVKPTVFQDIGGLQAH